MFLKCLTRLAFTLIVAVVMLKVSAVAATTMQLYVVWEQAQPETVKYYNVYMSNTQGQYTKPYMRITRLPTDRHGVKLTINVNEDGSTTTKYVIVKAVGENGIESGPSNELKLDASLLCTDLGVP